MGFGLGFGLGLGLGWGLGSGLGCTWLKRRATSALVVVEGSLERPETFTV